MQCSFSILKFRQGDRTSGTLLAKDCDELLWILFHKNIIQLVDGMYIKAGGQNID
jgi:hypothetical protein